MTDKIHVFPFPNDLYLMCDLLLLLLLSFARCKTLWHHLFEVIINCLNGLQLGYHCRYALCVVTGVITPQLLYLFLYLFRIMYIIMLYQVKAQPVCYTFYVCSLNIYVLYIILIYALPYNGDVVFNYFCFSGYLMMFFYFRPSCVFSLLFCCQAHTVNKVLLHIDNMLILVKVKLQTNGN